MALKADAAAIRHRKKYCNEIPDSGHSHTKLIHRGFRFVPVNTIELIFLYLLLKGGLYRTGRDATADHVAPVLAKRYGCFKRMKQEVAFCLVTP